ncbi:hypothetical protein BpHYR1_050906 [Brachionus plicatilis]|uniref:Uncharacterized protein n=1 Tax=Brachionus plicatilis TaxID=10195 RepID=A0A3M7RJS8_BRAPC|nr:hypothetical protein BpHYR1_050906 [Brachionus plicatilis]
MWPYRTLVLITILALNSVESLFVYYQNYEFFSTIKLNDYNGYYGNYSMPNDVLSAIWRLQLVSSEKCPPTDPKMIFIPSHNFKTKWLILIFKITGRGSFL